MEDEHAGMKMAYMIYASIIGLPLLCILSGFIRAIGCMMPEILPIFIPVVIVFFCCLHEFFHKNWLCYVLTGIWLIFGMITVVGTFIMLPIVLAFTIAEMEDYRNNH